MALDTISVARQEIAKIYIAAFNRAPDAAGLSNWINQYNAGLMTYKQISEDFSKQPEYTAKYPSAMTNKEYITAIYKNVFGRNPDDGGLQNWLNHLDSPTITGATRGNIMKTMIESASAPGNTDGMRLDNQATFAVKAVVTDGVPEATATAQLANITSVAATVTTATAAVAGSVGGVTGQTFTLTTGVDSIVGGAGNDTINAVQATTAFVLGALDTIDGGAGVDTLNVQDTTTAAGSFSFGAATIKNVEKINVTTNGNFTGLNTTGITGLTSFTGKAADTAATTLTVADTTDVTLTLGTTANSTVSGGKAVSVTKGDASTGTLGITGKALTTVTVKDGATNAFGPVSGKVTIDNLENSVAATTAKGTTLTSVILDSVDADADIKGEGLTSVTLKGVTTAARTTTVTNAKADHEITVNVDGTGYDATAAAQQSVFVDSVAKTITVNATGAKSSLSLAGSTSATTVNITGTADLTLNPLASATKVDGSTATGGLTLGTLNAATVTAKTGSGKDSLTLLATAKATVDTGAGNDTVTLASAVAAGSTINLGAGNDTLLVGGGSVLASTASAVTTIDAGEGIDSVAASLINAANAAQFKNFESIDLTAATVTPLDVELMTASTITGLTLSGTKGAATVNNVAAGVGLTVNANANAGAAITTIGVKNAATGTADSFAITFDATAGTTATATSKDTINAGTIAVNSVENITIASNGTGFVTNSAVITDSALQTLSVAGAQDMTLTFTGTNGTAVTGATDTVNGVKMIDASAATGVVTLNTTNVTNVANAGLTVKSGSANDSITLGQKATVDAGAGNDTIITSAAGGTLTGGAGNDTFNVSAAVAIAGAITEATGAFKTTITDIAAGDKIILAGVADSFTTAKVDLGAGVNNLDQALAQATISPATTATTWFQYANNTYIVVNDGTSGFGATDQVIKLSGLVDLSTATYSGAAADTLTIA